ncbi:MAG: hypothetical protein IPG54_11215 [Sphingomonadales bacterium]|nr:hypothetical protein [Sphingomonadales bacterium]
MLQSLIGELVERDEHERAALARRRRRLDEKVRLSTLLESALLHRAHPERIGVRGAAVAGIGHGNRWNILFVDGHARAPAFFLAAPDPAVILV